MSKHSSGPHRDQHRDPHFPAVHLRPPRHWVNDPNGLAFHDGHYHVYFQYNPHSARHDAMHWGHFRSRDLLRWELLPPALAPTPGGEDAEGVWSGNAVSHGGRLTAFYSAKRPDRWYQPVAAATSEDGGRTFTKRPGLLIPEPPEGLTLFRDPYVWREEDRWRMLVGAGLADGRGAAVHYASAGPEDLEHWEYRGVFLARAPQSLPGGGDTEEGWECAQYAPAGDGRGTLVISAWDPEEGARCAVAWPGREEGGAFAAGEPQRLDHGPDFYAPALLPAPDGRTLLWAWIWEARDEERVGAPSAWTDEAGWAGMLSLPRELSLGADGRVRQRPARELTALRGPRRISAAGQGPAALGRIAPAADLEVTLSGDAGMRLAGSADGREYLELRRDPDSGEVVADRDRASLDPRAKGGAWRLPAGDGDGATARLRILLDHSVAEIFTEDGRALTLRCYPVGGAAWSAHATGGAAWAVDAWDLDPPPVADLRPSPEIPAPRADTHRPRPATGRAGEPHSAAAPGRAPAAGEQP
ncbi:glycoside hydrolase family 32 protein [Streptomyces sp. DSM 44917]|uniref:beta-fructofuranosidase n=1 Tax=Streptomyces boetiae TaxID=3075541 RepID=A0ABU2LD65_9ACTN|nr:glycoside hydrolase family 32 protein [Streptomyces sp. DSM 44917]MDT0309232.1 glycoside hydrolase family 32 protein [Streptomyces sp. DSM 44917]